MAVTTPLTPGVYIEERSLLPPSVVGVATAVPAFIGYVAKALPATPWVAEINSLRDFEALFGTTLPRPYKVKLVDGVPRLYRTVPGAAPVGGGPPTTTDELVPTSQRPPWLLWHSLDLYFRNGGGRCYVVAVGQATDGGALSKDALLAGIKELEKQDEPTLIVTPEASLLSTGSFREVCEASLQHCSKMKDRFALLDVKEQGAGQPIDQTGEITTARGEFGSNSLSYGAAYYPFLHTTLTELVQESAVTVELPAAGGGEATTQTLDQLRASSTELYNKIKALLAEQRVTLPPSPAMAGVIVRVDRERGVWKAPANVGLQAIIAPVDLVTDDQQGLLNVDATTGKSINVIRSFAGRGTVVWGARTLAGNDNEWRYIPVRRLFITIEESVKKATSFAVFEPNDVSTWLKVKGMIESYLYNLWEQGALQGSKPESAFFVNVGLGKTMTAQDILNGIMLVEIGIAAVRPAEFIILRFSHRLAEA
ncbi:MAG: phage tail sheath family protein [Cyanobium sp.]